MSEGFFSPHLSLSYKLRKLVFCDRLYIERHLILDIWTPTWRLPFVNNWIMSRIMLRLCPGLVYAITVCWRRNGRSWVYGNVYLCSLQQMHNKTRIPCFIFHVRRKKIIKAACLLAFVEKKKPQKSLQSHFRLSVCPGWDVFNRSLGSRKNCGIRRKRVEERMKSLENGFL